jgi:hypothetical protein
VFAAADFYLAVPIEHSPLVAELANVCHSSSVAIWPKIQGKREAILANPYCKGIYSAPLSLAVECGQVKLNGGLRNL